MVIDDGVASATQSWRRAARRAGVPIVSVHDLGIGLGDADLVVDGSVAPPDLPPPALLGPRHAILSLPRGTKRHGAQTWDVVISLGGGPRRGIARRLALALVRKNPGVRVAVAGGFVAGEGSGRDPFTWLPPAGLLEALRATTAAIVAGGVTLYEALSLGVPSVGVAVVPAQVPTIEAFTGRGAVLAGGLLMGRDVRPDVGEIVDVVAGLLDDPVRRRTLSRAGRRIVDGRGAERVAVAIRRLVWRGRAGKGGRR
jgi:hypothetical protein